MEEILSNQDFLDVTQRIGRAKQYVKDWKTNIDRWRKLYNQNHYKFKLNDSQYNDPTHINTVDLAVGIMLANKTRWHAFGANPSRKEQLDTGKIEKLIDAVWEINDEREERSNMYELFLNFVRDGGGVLYSVFDPALAKELVTEIEVVDEESESGVSPRFAFKEPPIRVQAIDPSKIFAIPGGPKRWLMIGRSEEITFLDIQMMYPEINYPRMASMSDEEKAITRGEFIDVWDYVTKSGKLCVRNTILFDGFPVKPPTIMNGYSELPYKIQLYKPTNSSPEGWHNIMIPMESSVELLERTVNRRSKQIDIYTALPIISRTQTGRVVQVDPGLFNHVNIGTDESIEFPSWPGNAPDVQLHMEFLRSRVNQSGFSDVMFGGSGEAAGYAMSQMGDMNRIRMEQPIKHLELLLTSWSKMVINMITEFASDYEICIYGQHKGKNYSEYIHVEDLKGYSIRAEIRPSYPAEESRKVAMGSQAKGILSDYTIMERFFDIEQPEDEQERKMIEAASAHPLVVEYAIVSELKERADGGDEIAAMVLQSMQEQQGIPGQPGRPKDPVSPAGYSNVASATGELTPQERGGVPAGQSEQEKIQREASAKPGLM